MPPKQLSFLPKLPIDHGGDVRPGRRKTARPFDPRRPMHVVLRSSRARGEWSLLHPRHEKRVNRILRTEAERSQVRVYRSANVGNHLHLVIQAKKRADLQRFLRTVAGKIAFEVMGAKKTNPQGRFWDRLVYSRIVSWGREFEAVKRYLIKNVFEGAGLWNRKRDPHRKLITLKRDSGAPPPGV